MIIKVVLLVFLLYIPSACKQWFSAASEPVNNTYYQALIPRTGQTTCYDSSDAVTPCSGTGQDGEHQRGAAWPSPRFIEKVNGTITDRLTGLMWVKDFNLMMARDPTWDPDPSTNGAVTWQHALDYVAKLNNERYLGYSDWRLPNIHELASLANHGYNGYNYLWLAEIGFINIKQNYYWSSTTYPNDTANALIFSFENSFNGYILYPQKTGGTNLYYVLAVRGNGAGAAVRLPKTGQTTCYDANGIEISCAGTGQDGEHQAGIPWPSPRFIDNGNGTITDRLTGLMWLQNGGASGTLSWQSALDYVKTLTTGGYSDWRLPNSNELRSLQNCGQPNLAVWLNTQGFTGLSITYFSSTTVAFKTDEARVIDFTAPIMNPGAKTDILTVLAVRGGYAPPQ